MQMWINITLIILGVGFCASCENSFSNQSEEAKSENKDEAVPPLEVDSDSGRSSQYFEKQVILPDTSDLERTMIEQGLVNVADLEPSFLVEMMYSTTDNFLGEDVYGDYDRCYLQPEVAQKLIQAQISLIQAHPELRLILFDCVRPRSVQYQMWEIVKGTDQQNYVAPPGGSGSMHNYGAAVDLGLYHIDTGIVDMGTPFDFFGPLAQPRYETKFLQAGELSQAHINHRAILRKAMKGAGFQGILSEWWHFNGFDRDQVRRMYRIVE